VQLKVVFSYNGKAGELGKGAIVTMAVNGTKVAEGQLPKTIRSNPLIDGRHGSRGKAGGIGEGRGFCC